MAVSSSFTFKETEEIKKIIESLILSTDDASSKMEVSRKIANETAGQTDEAVQSLESIIKSVQTIISLNERIVEGTSTQTTEMSEINENSHNISTLASETSTMMTNASKSTGELAHLASTLQDKLRSIDDQ